VEGGGCNTGGVAPTSHAGGWEVVTGPPMRVKVGDTMGYPSYIIPIMDHKHFPYEWNMWI